MSIERGLINQARPIMLDARVQAFLLDEASKGCRAEIVPNPVAIEPPYHRIGAPRDLLTDDDHSCEWIQETPPQDGDLVWLRIWVSPEQKWDWARCEVFVRQLHGLSHRIGLEIVGNGAEVSVGLLCHRDDAPLVSGAFAGTFEACRLRPDGRRLAAVSAAEWATAVFFDCLPPPPYSHLLTRPNELPLSPYSTVIRAMAQIPPPALGLYQAIFQPVAPDHDWHRNVQVLLDLEYAVKLMTGFPIAARFAQQAPSGDLRQMAMDAETKAHNDKPFYAAALRVAVIGAEQADEHLSAMAAFTGLIQHGGRPLERVDARAYRARLSDQALRDMFQYAHTHHAGFLVNSAELTSLVHIPPVAVLEQPESPVHLLETLTPSDKIAHGSLLGYCDCAGERKPVCIPREKRFDHTHIIGRTGLGKSTVLEHGILDDIERGDGVAVLDPQRHLIDRLMDLISERDVERTIFIDFADPNVIPIFNPLRISGCQRLDEVAAEIVVAFKSFVQGWGDRLEHLLKLVILGLLHLPYATLLDVANALRAKSDEAKRLREEVLKIVEDGLLRSFWRDDLRGYTRADLAPPQHKLSKLLSGGPLALMLSQPDSLIDLRQVMDEGKILLLNFKEVGDEVQGFAGSLWLSLLRAAALSRNANNPGALRPFHIHVDEAHVFVTQTMERFVSETRKFGVSMTLAHHYLRQFSESQRDALCSVGTTIIRNIDSKDAAFLCKDLRGLVETDDITALEKTNAIARIGTEVVRFATRPPRTPTGPSQRDAIIAHSRKHYYRPAADVKKAIRDRQRRWDQPFAPLVPPHGGAFGGDPHGEELRYDEF